MKKRMLFLTLMTFFTTNLYAATGKASYYGGAFHGRKAADGSIFNQNALTTAAAPHIKMGSSLLVTNSKTGKSVVVKVTDRGSFHKAKYNRVLDLSKGAFSRIAPLSQGVIKIKYQVL